MADTGSKVFEIVGEPGRTPEREVPRFLRVADGPHILVDENVPFVLLAGALILAGFELVGDGRGNIVVRYRPERSPA